MTLSDFKSWPCSELYMLNFYKSPKSQTPLVECIGYILKKTLVHVHIVYPVTTNADMFTNADETILLCKERKK